VRTRTCGVALWLKIQLGFEAPQVFTHQARGLSRVAQFDRREQGPVFLAATGGGILLRQDVRLAVRHQNQRRARDEFAQDAPQGGVAGAVGDQQMEVAREANGPAHVAGCTGRFLFLDAVAEVADVTGGGHGDESLDQRGFDQAPHLEHFSGFPLAGLGDGCTPVGRERHHLLIGQAHQHRPDAGARDAKRLRQPVFDQFGAGRQLVVENGRDHALVHRLICRSGLHAGRSNTPPSIASAPTQGSRGTGFARAQAASPLPQERGEGAKRRRGVIFSSTTGLNPR
jgi:hypothetical protein